MPRTRRPGARSRASRPRTRVRRSDALGSCSTGALTAVLPPRARRRGRVAGRPALLASSDGQTRDRLASGLAALPPRRRRRRDRAAYDARARGAAAHDSDARRPTAPPARGDRDRLRRGVSARDLSLRAPRARELRAARQLRGARRRWSERPSRLRSSCSSRRDVPADWRLDVTLLHGRRARPPVDGRRSRCVRLRRARARSCASPRRAGDAPEHDDVARMRADDGAAQVAGARRAHVGSSPATPQVERQGTRATLSSTSAPARTAAVDSHVRCAPVRPAGLARPGSPRGRRTPSSRPSASAGAAPARSGSGRRRPS